MMAQLFVKRAVLMGERSAQFEAERIDCGLEAI